MRRFVAAAMTFALLLAACSPSTESAETTGAAETTTTERPLPTSAPPMPPMEVTSTAFEEGESIPAKYTCDGEDVSPQLDVEYVPSGTAVFALIVDDPDAPVGVWDHWVEFDIPYTEGFAVSWRENAGAGRIGTAGVNSWNVTGYRGPCPPGGQDHRYFFTVYALDTELLIPEGVTSEELRNAMEGHIVAEAQLMGTYSR